MNWHSKLYKTAVILGAGYKVAMAVVTVMSLFRVNVEWDNPIGRNSHDRTFIRRHPDDPFRRQRY